MRRCAWSPSSVRRVLWLRPDTVGRSLKAQMKYADKIGAVYTLVLGDNELAAGKANLKRMADGQQQEVELCQLTRRPVCPAV